MPTIECVTDKAHIANCAPGCCTPQDKWNPDLEELVRTNTVVRKLEFPVVDEQTVVLS